MTDVRTKIRLFRKSEKSRFKIDPLNAGKTLLDPKNYTILKVDKHFLDAHKSSSLQDKFYDILLGELEELQQQPSWKKVLSKSTLSYYDFLNISLKHRNASGPGTNTTSYKVYRKCPKLSKCLLKMFF